MKKIIEIERGHEVCDDSVWLQSFKKSFYPASTELVDFDLFLVPVKPAKTQLEELGSLLIAMVDSGDVKPESTVQQLFDFFTPVQSEFKIEKNSATYDVFEELEKHEQRSRESKVLGFNGEVNETQIL